MNEIRDPIHGFITPNNDELKIINTALFQRLRKIKQLAMAYLVYPGANHTRFDHSLGVYHIASKMAEKLLESEDDGCRRIVKFAAILHDVGHGPFSHVSESVLDKYSDFNSEKEKVHEKITKNIIQRNKELANLLSPSDIEDITGLLTGENINVTLMKEIVSGPLDADKIDYLLRDTYFCGVKYGVFDIDRMLNTMKSYKDGTDIRIAINYDGINSLEQFALAKYYMTIQIYKHKIRTLSDAMIIRGLELGIEKDEIDFLKKLYQYNDDDEYIDNYLKYWDDRIISEILSSDKDGFAKCIFTRLYERNLFKRIFSEKYMDIEMGEEIKEQIINITKRENKKIRDELEKQISEILNCDQNFVIANSFTIKSVKEMHRDSEAGVMIINRNGKGTSFEQESTVFSSIDESMKDVYFEVYAPLEYTGEQDKKRKLDKFGNDISAILKQMKV